MSQSDFTQPRKEDHEGFDHPIETRTLSHVFGTGQAATQVLFDIDLRIAKGSFTVLRGASGSGKTTLLTLLGSLRDLRYGQAWILGTPLHGAKESNQTDLRRRSGFIFQAHNLHESLTALQNVRLGLSVHGKGADKNWRVACAHLLTVLGLGDRLNYKPHNLSGGQKQRVAVARALISNPNIVFADEPTAALDEVSATNVVNLLKDLGRVRGTTTLMVTHDQRVAAMANRIITLADGRLVEDTAPI